MLVSELITIAYYKAGIVSPAMGSPDSRQTLDGLNLLNELLRKLSINSSTVPFYISNVLQFQTEPNVQTYQIGNISSIETITLINQGVRYPLRPNSLKEFYLPSRQLNVPSLPFCYYLERQGLTMYNVSFYFIPDKVYEIDVKALQPVGQMGISSLLDSNLDFYFDFIIYSLAARLCTYNQLSIPSDVASELKDYKNLISKMIIPDMVVASSGLLKGSSNYTDRLQISLIGSWVP